MHRVVPRRTRCTGTVGSYLYGNFALGAGIGDLLAAVCADASGIKQDCASFIENLNLIGYAVCFIVEGEGSCVLSEFNDLCVRSVIAGDSRIAAIHRYTLPVSWVCDVVKILSILKSPFSDRPLRAVAICRKTAGQCPPSAQKTTDSTFFAVFSQAFPVAFPMAG